MTWDYVTGKSAPRSRSFLFQSHQLPFAVSIYDFHQEIEQPAGKVCDGTFIACFSVYQRVTHRDGLVKVNPQLCGFIGYYREQYT